jgi:DNA polymerase V
MRKGNQLKGKAKAPQAQSIKASPSRQRLTLAMAATADLETKITEIFTAAPERRYSLDLHQQPVSAGFPSPVEDFLEGKLELNRYLIQHPASTFFVRANGNSMHGAGIYSGDLLIVDRSLEATSGQIVIAVLNGELTVKRLWLENDRLFLKAENNSYPPIEVTEPQELCIWGVVTSAIHRF